MLGETTLQTLLFVFEAIGVLAFAFSGALAAVRKRLDVVGVVVIAFSHGNGWWDAARCPPRSPTSFLGGTRVLALGGDWGGVGLGDYSPGTSF